MKFIQVILAFWNLNENITTCFGKLQTTTKKFNETRMRRERDCSPTFKHVILNNQLKQQSFTRSSDLKNFYNVLYSADHSTQQG